MASVQNSTGYKHSYESNDDNHIYTESANKRCRHTDESSANSSAEPKDHADKREYIRSLILEGNSNDDMLHAVEKLMNEDFHITDIFSSDEYCELITRMPDVIMASYDQRLVLRVFKFLVDSHYTLAAKDDIYMIYFVEYLIIKIFMENFAFFATVPRFLYTIYAKFKQLTTMRYEYSEFFVEAFRRIDIALDSIDIREN